MSPPLISTPAAGAAAAAAGAAGGGGGGRGGRKKRAWLLFVKGRFTHFAYVPFNFFSSFSFPLLCAAHFPLPLKAAVLCRGGLVFAQAKKLRHFLALEKMAGHANVPLGCNFYATPKRGGVSLLLIRDGNTKSHLGLEFRLLVGALRCVGKNAQEIQGHQDFEGHVKMTEKDTQLAIVGSTYESESFMSKVHW